MMFLVTKYQESHTSFMIYFQLTVERIRGSQRARSNALEPLQTLKCLKSVVEDWHSEVAIMKVTVVCALVLMPNL